jgi:hypothetical protein
MCEHLLVAEREQEIEDAQGASGTSRPGVAAADV